ncbi:hypothetical protein CY34DRAFT_359429 [Suillus luteus UH-Slu-Lm8-n1]|uniref:Uncharacterized protein n=1 Tax=Suillus luteus UH-Slu-Lm8-n1 TaxID=930992 RepID=A0A0D0A9H4_9AGAM|nr:hypothetical protein CY34DRAFT_359429 [Suillus luteus UH-Slu-Lm8-n1]
MQKIITSKKRIAFDVGCWSWDRYSSESSAAHIASVVLSQQTVQWRPGLNLRPA